MARAQPNRSFKIALAAVALWGYAAGTGQAATFLALSSRPGDPVGGGLQQVLLPRQAPVVVHEAGLVTVRFESVRGDEWSLTFAAPPGAELLATDYENVTGHPASLPRPALQVTLDGAPVCASVSGRFVVLQADYAPDGTTQRFAAEFEQHCNAAAPALYGTISVDSLLPVPRGPAPTPTPSAYFTSVELDSQPGDFVGGGVRRILAPTAGLFTAVHGFGLVEIDFNGGAEDSWIFSFVAPSGSELLPGTYGGARRYPNQSPVKPGLSASGQARGCDELTGSFVVLEAEYGSDGTVARFAANFEQHCEGSAPALFGTVRFNSHFAPNAPTPIPSTPTPTPTLYVTYALLESQAGDHAGGGQDYTLLPGDGLFTITHEPGHVSVQFDGDDDWGFDFAAPQGTELLPGTYTDAQEFPFQSPARPRLNIHGPRGPCPAGGSFAILEVVYAADGSVERFAANFEQHCSGLTPALIGVLRYNSTVSVIAPTPTPLAPTPTPGRYQTFLLLQSDPGEYVAEGEHLFLTEADAVFVATHEPGHIKIELQGGSDDTWFLDFQAPQNSDLLPGDYPNAERAPSPFRAGLDIWTLGRDCETARGRFTISEAEYGEDGTIKRFAADFEQHCRFGGPALFGSVRLNSSAALPSTPTPSPTADPNMVRLSVTGFGLERTLNGSDANFYASHTFGHTQVSLYGPEVEDWSLDFAAPQGQELLTGTYDGAGCYPWQDATQPGLGVITSGLSCAGLIGRFDVREAQYDDEGDVYRFVADFEQHYAGQPVVLHGNVTFISPVPTPTPDRSCSGDCNGDGIVTVADIVLGLDIALGNAPLSACPTFDVNGDGTLGIEELLASVRSANRGCNPGEMQ